MPDDSFRNQPGSPNSEAKVHAQTTGNTTERHTIRNGRGMCNREESQGGDKEEMGEFGTHAAAPSNSNGDRRNLGRGGYN
ncbi:hypothetical protein UCREL1_10067 [Eutypa lata UCREL1]|uniref:Uncharacterized protein n=1 Tax=Eutypa lata (strain UCR-EL1) TaxID=1287681 RepID=M7SA35_EUTLA|nr:hypothetical protein UCREL1_10067 [Eutypa lata UCREL1]